MSFTRLAKSALVGATLACLAAPAAFGQQTPAQGQAVQAKRTQHGDWALICPPPGVKADCFIEQVAVAKDTQRALMASAVGFREPTGKALSLALRLPPAAVKEAGLAIKIDDAEPAAVPIQGCDAKWCSTTVFLNDADIARLKKGNGALVLYKVEDKTFAAPMSLKGFTAAVNALLATR